MHLSRLGYYADFCLYPLLIAMLALTVPLTGQSQSGGLWLAVFAGSLLLWTLLEYLLHRFALHRVPLFERMHQVHHDDERGSVGTPSWLSLGLFAAVIFLPAWAAGGYAFASAATAGMMTGYFWYISVHHIVHHWHPGHSGYVYALKRRHAMHHHVDQSANFGVTSGFWDRVFGTALEPERSTRPAATRSE